MLVLPSRLVAETYRIATTTAAAGTLLAGTAAVVLYPPRAAVAAPPPARSAVRSSSAAGAEAKRPDAASGEDAAAATASSPRILFGGVPLPVPSPDRAPYRDPADGQVCVAPESLEPLGITYIVDAADGAVSLAGPGGAASTTVPLRRRPGASPASDTDAPVFVPAKQVVEALGGKWEEEPANGICYAFTVLTDIQMIGGQLRVRATLPVMPKVRTERDRPNLVIVDFPGADVGALPRMLKLDSPNVAQARTGQFSDDTARLVLNLKPSTYGPAPGGFSVLGARPATQIVLNPEPAEPSSSAPASTAVAAVVISNDNTSGVVTAHRAGSATATMAAAAAAAAAKAGAQPTVIRNVAFRSISDREAQVVVQAGRAPAVRADLARGRLTLDIVNATLASSTVADALSAAKHPFLRAAQLIPRGSSAAQLVLDLRRAVNYTVRMIPGGGFVLDLMMPEHAGGRLAGKLVVIDPGHGGHDSGAHGVDGSREKNVNLAIASRLAESLRSRGANVILTRSDDEFIPVDGRPAIANHAGADFFISIHADSGDRNHVVNGSTVYYHMQVPSCKALAQCIAERLAGLGAIHCKGPHSDGLQYGGRFMTGYGVLRNAQMVAVLCECGYMSNASDVRRLNDPATQQQIAQEIADGLRDYVEGNPDFDTRNINPQPDGTLAPLPAAPPPPDDGAAGTGTSPAGDGGAAAATGAAITAAPASDTAGASGGGGAIAAAADDAPAAPAVTATPATGGDDSTGSAADH